MPHPRDLEDRLVKFAAVAARVAGRLPRSPVGAHLADQLLRAALAPAPNYGEAQGAESRRDFVHKMRVCQKELRECLVLLKLVIALDLDQQQEVRWAADEADQLVAIFTSSVVTAMRNGKRREGLRGQSK